MSFSTDIAGLVADQLTRFVTLNRHQLAGQAANLDFWLEQVRGALAAIDGYGVRFVRMTGAQEQYTTTHETTEFSFGADHHIGARAASPSANSRRRGGRWSRRPPRFSIGAAATTSFPMCSWAKGSARLAPNVNRKDRAGGVPMPDDAEEEFGPGGPKLWPLWVSLGLWGLPDRGWAWGFFRFSLLVAGAGAVGGFFFWPAFLAVGFVFAAVWYYAAIRWVGQNSEWP